MADGSNGDFFLLDPDPEYSLAVLDPAPTSISDNRWLFNLFAELREKLISPLFRKNMLL